MDGCPAATCERYAGEIDSFAVGILWRLSQIGPKLQVAPCRVVMCLIVLREGVKGAAFVCCCRMAAAPT